MKVRIATGALALCLTLILTISGSDGFAQEQVITLKMAHQALPPDSTLVKTSNHWADLVNQRTNGKIQVKIFYDTLAKGADAFAAVQQGGIADALEIVCSFISPRVKDVAPLELPGAYPPKRFPEVADQIRPIMTEIMEAQGIKYLGVQYTFSALVVASKDKHYRSPADMQGQKMRIPGMWMTKALAMWGATPTMILPPEMYNATQTGVVDACGSILDLIALLKLYEVGPYVTEWPDTTIAMVMFGMNMTKFKSLTPQHQEVLIQAAKDAEKFSFDYGTNLENKLREEIKAKPNVKYLMLNEEEVKSFLQPITIPLYKEAREYCGPQGDKLMDVFDKMMKRDTR